MKYVPGRFADVHWTTFQRERPVPLDPDHRDNLTPFWGVWSSLFSYCMELAGQPDQGDEPVEVCPCQNGLTRFTDLR